MKKEKTKKQHYVPRFYLKRFANEKNFIEVLDLEKKSISKPRSYASVCYEEFFYALETGKDDNVNQEIEKTLAQIESKIAPELNDIEKNVITGRKITNGELYTLASLMSMLYVRGIYMRKQTQRLEKDMAKKIMSLHASHINFKDELKQIAKKELKQDISDEEAEKVQEIFQQENYDLSFNNSGHLLFLSEMEKFANLFYGKKWRFYYSYKDISFITSDVPLIEWFPKKKRFYGYTILERKHYLALSPHLLIELINPYEPGKKVKRKMIEQKKADYFNHLIATYSDSFCYSKNKELLQRLIDIRKKVLELAIKNKVSNSP